MWESSPQRVSGHFFTETEFIDAGTGTCNLMWMSRLEDEIHIPIHKQAANLIIDNKPSITCHEGMIVENDASDLYFQVDSNVAYNIVNRYGPSKRPSAWNFSIVTYSI